MPRLSAKLLAYLLVAITLTVACATLLFPELDLEVSAWWFDFENNHFPYNKSWWAVGIYYLVKILAVIYSVLGVALLAVGAWRWHKLGKPRMFFLTSFVLASYILSAGVAVHQIYKPIFGRARPLQITEFNGDKIYSAPYAIAGQCATNCSFVSGHAAMGYVLGMPFFFSRRHRYRWLSLGILSGWIFGSARIIQGAHFLSDVTWSFVVVFSTSWLVYHAMLWLRQAMQSNRASAA